MSYIVGFFNKYKFQVDDETGKKLQDAWIEGKRRAFRINGNAFAFSAIEDILDKDSAYSRYPTEYEMLQGMEDEVIQSNSLELESGDTPLLN